MAVHDLGFEKKSTTNQGFLTPIGVTEVLPGDVVKHKIDLMLRTQPLLAPVYHSVDVKIHNFFVPMRLIWDEWEDFITGGPDGNDTSVPPTVNSGGSGFAIGSLADHLGMAVGVVNIDVSALPFRAYNLVYNEFYRDQDIEDTPVANSLAGGADTTSNTDLLVASWEKDYFTTCRPDTQKGDEVEIALTGNAPVVTTGDDITISGTGGTSFTNQTIKTNAAGDMQPNTGSNNTAIQFGDESGLEADLSNVGAVSINDLRLATALQRYKENMLTYGSRYAERMAAAFGVKNIDARLQRPEYLGGGSNVIQFSEVLDTGSAAGNVGTLKGHGINVTSSNRYHRKIPEYGYIISFLTIRPKTAYQQGNPRMYNRETKEEFFQPELEHIGMQAVKNKELYAAAADPDGTFGYQNRYDEYRYRFDEVSGEFRDTLDFWHMGRIFGSEPALNEDFVKCEGVDRPFAVPADEFQVRAIHNMPVRRKLSARAIPLVY